MPERDALGDRLDDRDVLLETVTVADMLCERVGEAVTLREVVDETELDRDEVNDGDPLRVPLVVGASEALDETLAPKLSDGEGDDNGERLALREALKDLEALKEVLRLVEGLAERLRLLVDDAVPLRLVEVLREALALGEAERVRDTDALAVCEMLEPKLCETDIVGDCEPLRVVVAGLLRVALVDALTDTDALREEGRDAVTLRDGVTVRDIVRDGDLLDVGDKDALRVTLGVQEALRVADKVSLAPTATTSRKHSTAMRATLAQPETIAIKESPERETGGAATATKM